MCIKANLSTPIEGFITTPPSTFFTKMGFPFTLSPIAAGALAYFAASDIALGSPSFSASAVFLVAAIIYYSKLKYTERFANGYRIAPTIWSAWIPILASGLEIGKNPDKFTGKYHAVYGPVFQTKLLGDSLFFVQDFHFPAHMSRHPTIFSFHDLMKDKVLSIFGISVASEHEKILLKWSQKYLLSVPSLTGFTNCYSSHLLRSLQEKTTPSCTNPSEFQEINLMEFVNPLVFYSAIRAFFGNYDSTLEESKLCEKILLFDDFFVHIASGLMPEMLLKQPREAQRFVGNYLTTRLAEEERTEMSMALATMLGVDAAKVAFMLAWALNTNSMPVIFWMMLFVLRNKEAQEKVIDEVCQVLRNEIGWDMATATEFPKLNPEIVQKMPLMRSLMFETLRKRSSINLGRKVTKDTIISVGSEKFIIPKNAIVNATSPHHNAEVFPEPEKFQVDRFLDGTSYYDHEQKKIAVPNMAFGHGVHQCPGRKFALMEGPITVALLLTCFDWEVVNPEAPEPPPHFERFQFGCMPLHPDYFDSPSIRFRIRVKPQFMKGLKNNAPAKDTF